MIKEVISHKYIGNAYGLIVPLTVAGKIEGEFDYEVYDTFFPLLQEELHTRIDDYLTECFFQRMNLLLTPAAALLGYAPDADLTHSFLLHYRAQKACDSSGILSSTVCVEDIGAYTVLTDAEFDTDEFPVFATLQGGRIVSVCGANGFLTEDTVEIAVETAAGMRGNGYARSNVCAMVNYLTCQGYGVAYQCYPENTASAALAASCGLVLYSRDYHFVCYEKEA